MKIERTVTLRTGLRVAILVDDAGKRWAAPLHERDGKRFWRPAECVRYGEAVTRADARAQEARAA